MSFNIHIGPVSENPEATIDLVFGKNVSADRIIDSAQQSACEKEKCGLITTQEAIEMIKQIELQLKAIDLG